MHNTLCLVLAALLACQSLVSATGASDYLDNEIPDLLSPLENWEDLSQAEDEDVAAPAPCCFPKTWQGTISSAAGFSSEKGPGFVSSTSTMSIDSPGRRIAGNKKVGKSGNETESFIVIFGRNNTADMYLFKAAEKKCLYKKLNEATFRPQCIPPNATLIESFSLGAKAGGLQVDSWLFEGHSPPSRRGPKIFMVGKILVANGCVPVLIEDRGEMIPQQPRKGADSILRFLNRESASSSSESESVDADLSSEKPKPSPNPRGVKFVASAYFSNLQTTVSPGVFTPPSYCKKSIENGEDVTVPSVLERFISY